MRKALFISIFIMTILDIAITSAGIHFGYVEEGNPIMQGVFHASPEWGAFIVAVSIGFLLLFMYKVQHRIRFINVALVGLFIIKLAVLFVHFNWIVQVI